MSKTVDYWVEVVSKMIFIHKKYLIFLILVLIISGGRVAKGQWETESSLKRMEQDDVKRMISEMVGNGVIEVHEGENAKERLESLTPGEWRKMRMDAFYRLEENRKNQVKNEILDRERHGIELDIKTYKKFSAEIEEILNEADEG